MSFTSLGKYESLTTRRLEFEVLREKKKKPEEATKKLKKGIS